MAENISDAFLCTAANGIMVEKIWINQLFSENVLLKIILCYLKNYIMLFKMSFSNLNHIFIKKKKLILQSSNYLDTNSDGPISTCLPDHSPQHSKMSLLF